METALLLIAHGSRQPEANADLHHVAEGLRRRGHAVVEAAFLELAEPDIDAAGARCAAMVGDSLRESLATCGASRPPCVGRVVLVPYFLSAGVHVQRDLTAARDRLAARFPGVEFRLAEPLGRHPLLLDVVEARAREAVKD